MCLGIIAAAAAASVIVGDGCGRNRGRGCGCGCGNGRFLEPEMTIHRNTCGCREERSSCNPCCR